MVGVATVSASFTSTVAQVIMSLFKCGSDSGFESNRSPLSAIPGWSYSVHS